MVIRSVLLIKKVEYCFRPSVDMLILYVCKKTCLFETIPQVETNKIVEHRRKYDRLWKERE
jgi:hypothetical protein